MRSLERMTVVDLQQAARHDGMWDETNCHACLSRKRITCASVSPPITFDIELAGSFPFQQLFVWIMERIARSSRIGNVLVFHSPKEISDLVWLSWGNCVPVVNSIHVLSELRGTIARRNGSNTTMFRWLIHP
jgi:hypothetical protein